PDPPPALREGQTVRSISLSVSGKVASVRGPEAEILVGNMKLRRPLTDLEVLDASPIHLPPGVRVHVSTKQLDRNEINVVGRKVDEAVEMADKFLDDAVMSQMTTVR